MFNSIVINLVILLSFTYFIASLMLSSINEAIASSLNARAQLLKKTLLHLFDDPQWAAYIENQFYKSLHIQALQKDAKKLPSYIPGDNFILTLIDNIGYVNYDPALIERGISESMLPPSIKQVLLELWSKSKSNIDENAKNPMQAFETEIKKYYNNAMDRAGGIYKRNTRNMIWALGLLLCIIFNIDTIQISNKALSDPAHLNLVAGSIAAATANLHPSQPADSATSVKQAKDKLLALQAQYDSTTGYHFGYQHSMGAEWGASKDQDFQFKVFLLKLLGILLTTFALQLGSTYWFEVLSKFVNLRATGKKPEEVT
ncbi:MAG: hypothetical protein J7539_16865 [Niabella sp.]|nr:hypothetical protein [Niabella sp.]